jgi:hypothetical protein
MGQRLKRWESPRREGRNDKGKGGSARQRQLKKRQQMLRQKLQDNSNSSNKGRDFIQKSLLFCGIATCVLIVIPTRPTVFSYSISTG